MIRRPPRSTLDRSSAASDVYKRQEYTVPENPDGYLRENYGPNYMTPIKEWDYVEAPTNQEKLKGGDIVMIEYYN